MVFSSVIFLFLFLPAVLAAYYIVPKRFRQLRNIVLLLFSLAFYFYGEPKLILVMIFSIIINYVFGILVHNAKVKNKTGKIQLISAVTINLAILFYFKYFDFFLININTIFKSDIPLKNIVMPIGISFYTFQAMSYVFDVYYDKAGVQRNILKTALYISMFPQLIAGPIVRYNSIDEEISYRNETAERFALGIKRFVSGFAKKIILANSMGLIADEVFALPYDFLTFDLAWIGAVAYSFQIFFDFSAYSEMAIGLGHMFGLTFLENFNYPYISKSITEFWRRWHMSLGTWFRDYVYIPLGGNRTTVFRHILNIFVVWFLTGFWHGAAWNFIIWGLFFAVILIFEKYFLFKYVKNLNTVIAHIYTLILVIISWVIFRSDNMTYAFYYIVKMFSINLSKTSSQSYFYLLQYRYEWLLCVMFSIPIGQFIRSRISKFEEKPFFGFLYQGIGYFVVISVFFVSIGYLISSTFNPFIYFRF